MMNNNFPWNQFAEYDGQHCYRRFTFMDKKSIFIITLIFLCQFSFAETCPSVNDIKTKNLHSWKAYDSDDGMPLSAQRLAQFKQDAQQFILAEWPNQSHQNSRIHC